MTTPTETVSISPTQLNAFDAYTYVKSYYTAYLEQTANDLVEATHRQAYIEACEAVMTAAPDADPTDVATLAQDAATHAYEVALTMMGAPTDEPAVEDAA